MMSKLKQVLLLLCALGILCSSPLFLSRRSTIETNMPALSSQEIIANKKDYQRYVAEQEAEERARRLAKKRAANYACQADSDCIIVDKDPCGCLVGPEGVTAINASRSLEFSQSLGNVMAKACPDGAPSTEKECSPTARAVCRNKVCKIVY